MRTAVITADTSYGLEEKCDDFVEMSDIEIKFISLTSHVNGCLQETYTALIVYEYKEDK